MPCACTCTSCGRKWIAISPPRCCAPWPASATAWMPAMLPRSSLRSRIVQACVILAAIVCAVYALLLLAGIHALEDRLLNDRMFGSADDLIRNHVQRARGPVGGDPQVYQDGEIPASMRGLPPGEVHE